MPDYFTHHIAAELIYERLDGEHKKILTQDKTLYMLGAQGGDVFFFYGLSYKYNPGRILHRMAAAELFEKLCKGNAAYCAGWATHYALDCTVHPFVYAYEETHKGAFLHQRYERDFGLYVSRRCNMRRMILPRERVLDCTFAACDSVKRLLPYINAAGTASCLKRHFAYTLRQFKSKKQQFELDCDYSETYKAFERGLELGVKCVESALDKNIDGEIFNKSFLQK